MRIELMIVVKIILIELNVFDLILSFNVFVVLNVWEVFL